MDTIGFKIFRKAKQMLDGAAGLPDELVHQLETVADEAEYALEDEEMAAYHAAEAKRNGRSMTDPFLYRVYQESLVEDEKGEGGGEAFPTTTAEKVNEMVKYVSKASQGILTPQWLEFVEYAVAAVDGTLEEETAEEVADAKTKKAPRVRASKSAAPKDEAPVVDPAASPDPAAN